MGGAGALVEDKETARTTDQEEGHGVHSSNVHVSHMCQMCMPHVHRVDCRDVHLHVVDMSSAILCRVGKLLCLVRCRLRFVVVCWVVIVGCELERERVAP